MARTYLTLIIREAVYLGLQVLDLVLLLLVDRDLLGYVVLALLLLGVHRLDLLLQALLVFLALRQLDLNVAETLFQLLYLSHGHAQLLDRLGGADEVRGLHRRDGRRELRRRLNCIKGLNRKC